MPINNQQNTFKFLFGVALVVIAGMLIYTYWPRTNPSVEQNVNQAVLPNIPTPAGWYSWGTNHYPDYETSTLPNSMTFGDQPINNSGNNTTTLINVNVQNLSGQTDEQWIETDLYPSLQQVESPSSSLLWSVMNGRLVLGSVVKNPSGGYDVVYHVFDNGVIYSFSLNPWHTENLLTSSDAQTLKTMVQNFAESLPANQ
jgi:hypothetical protein